jgi:hypothetical protein
MAARDWVERVVGMASAVDDALWKRSGNRASKKNGPPQQFLLVSEIAGKRLKVIYIFFKKETYKDLGHPGLLELGRPGALDGTPMLPDVPPQTPWPPPEVE